MATRVSLGGRFVSQYDPNTALIIVERIANGETLTDICRTSPHMPQPATFRRWAANNPDLAQALIAAIIISASSLEEEALNTARAIALLPKDGVHVQAAKVKLEQLRWSAERRDPTKFGVRSQINVKVPIQINTTMDLGQEKGNVAEGGIYTIEATQAASIEDASKGGSGRPLVIEERVSGGKRVLVPPSGPKPRNPFGKIARGVETYHEGSHVRPEGHQRSDREGLPLGPGDKGVHGQSEDAGTLPQEPPQHREEATPSNRENLASASKGNEEDV